MTANDLLTRGVAHIIPRDLSERKFASGKPLRIYWGIDPTGSRIHLGHSVPLRKMKQFADAGHHVILLIGSFTAMIGDPSDKEAMRQPLTRADVEKNFQTYKEQVAKILDFSKVEVRYNHEWLEKLNLEEVLKLASNFTIQQLQQRDMFAKRLKEDKPVSFHEFHYPLMVGYDSVVLDVDCEIGGSEQEFNMLAGRTLQKAFGKREKFVMTVKLIEGLDGRKMSKTYENCVYLDDEPNDMFGKLMSLRDDLMEKYFECCTDVPMAEARKILKGKPREAKARLAREIVTLYHGTEAATEAEKAFNAVFRDRGVPEDMPEVKAKKGESLIDLLVRAKVIASKGEGRRLIEQKGIHMNDDVVTSVDALAEKGLTPEALAKGVVVKVGKRKFVRVFFAQ